MRILLLTLGVASLVGCVNDKWTLSTAIDLECDAPLRYFIDRDRDGWGEFGGEVSVEACNPATAVDLFADELPADATVAANNIDCLDDPSPDSYGTELTYRAGLCPEEFVADGAGTFFTPFSTTESEFVVVHDELRGTNGTVVQSARNASDLCGGFGGWGGGASLTITEGTDGDVVVAQYDQGSLLSLAGDDYFSILEGLTETLSGELGADWSQWGYAGWVSVVSSEWVNSQDAGFGLPVLAAGWYWEGADGTYRPVDEIAEVPFCGEEPDLEQYRLALVWDGSNWCVGGPLGVQRNLSPSAIYEDAGAHLICHRPVRAPEDWVGESRPVGDL